MFQIPNIFLGIFNK